MKITSAIFIKGLMGDDELLHNGIPQTAFIGRSNVGKSSVINALVNKHDLAKSSSRPGKTKEINLFLINKSFYLVDLPGYGFAKASLEERENLRKLIYWYLLYFSVEQKNVVLIVDAFVGLTDYDIEILRRLDDRGRRVIIVANKVDRIKKADFQMRLDEIRKKVSPHEIIPFSAEKKIGIEQLANKIFSNENSVTAAAGSAVAAKES